ncbi:MAG: peptidoglycan DD-metalloendopeptidase family protein [Prevotellaceae bacterium]|nr:peptidoglycan DD-metalloendopeptidase family protein [Prevotellaceae bacterium]
MRLLLTILLALLALSPSVAQNSKKVKDLKSQQTKLQQNLKKSKTDLDNTRKSVKKGQQNIKALDREIEMRVQFIHRTEAELDSLSRQVDSLKQEIKVLDSVLTERKQKYTQALRMAQAYHKVNSTLLFALAAKDINQMYRRLRYTREYASYQRSLGEQVQAAQLALLERQNLLLTKKSEVSQKMQSLIEERRKLTQQQVEEQNNVKSLQKKEQGLQKQVKDQNAQIQALQKKIDQQVALEIEQARKKAEEEARRKAAASGSKTGGIATGKTAVSPGKWLTAEDQKLNGSFENNKGRLPVPITGQYMIAAHYASNVSGSKNVTLQNKGTNYMGKSGARARAVFDGEVSAVFSLGGMKNVLVRHGSYISVYCNLSSVIVAKGQKVKARDLLGTVANDGTGNYMLHFQLRKETTVLNPEQWVGR